MLLLAFSAASADTWTCDYGDTLANIVGLGRRDLETSVVIEITEGECTYDMDEVVITGSGKDWLFRPTAATGVVRFPPLAATDGTTVTVERMVFSEPSAALGIGLAATDYFDFGPGARLYAHEATLTLVDVELDGGEGAGLVVVDATVAAENLTASGFEGLRAVYAVAENARTTLTLTAPALAGNTAGALFLYGLGEDVEAQIDGGVLEANGPASGADIWAYDVASLTVSEATFEGSVGSAAYSDGASAPLFVAGGSFACRSCTFAAGTGGRASVLAAYPGAGDVVELVQGDVEPASYAEPSMWIDGAGSVSITGTTFRAAGPFVRYAGDTALWTPRFLGEGIAVDQALKLVGTDSILDGLTLCGYTGAGYGLIASYGSTVTLTDTVAHGLSLGGDPVIKGYPTPSEVDLVVRDNTLAGSEAALVGGTIRSLEYTNNLVTEATAGIDAFEEPTDLTVTYNLFHETGTPSNVGTLDGSNLVGPDPRLVGTFTPGDCETYPFLTAASPANAAGDPSYGDGYGNERSDIGALDWDDEGGGDTGDTDPTDTGGETGDPDGGDTGDSGVVDTSGGGDTDEPALVGGALPPCGCGDDGGAAALLALAPLLLVRRRRA